MKHPHLGDQLDQICDAFEAAWQSGQRPDPAEWILRCDESLQPLLKPAILQVDLEYRLKAGLPIEDADSYIRSFGLQPADISLTRNRFATPLTISEGQSKNDQPVSDQSTVGLKSAHSDTARGYSLNGAGGAPIQFGDYEVLHELGRGGMGVVYRARHRELEREVALKTIRADVANVGEAVSRFRREAKAAARLRHPNIVAVLDSGVQDGTPWFAMELVTGRTLKAEVGSQPLPAKDAVRLVLQIADALQHAHEQNVVHRDIKPSNILVDETGARVTDFGLARISDHQQTLTSSGEILGTAAFMAPEQAAGDSSTADDSCDIYAVGAVLYFALTGRPPFQAASTIEILRQVTNDEPVPVRRLNAEVDLDLEVLCLKCLQKRPADRFASMTELAAELRRYLNGEPIRSRPVSRATRFVRWCQRMPYVAASFALAIALLCFLAVGVPLILLEINSRQNAEQLATANAARAATQEYYAGIQQVREQRLSGEAGWTWEALATLKRLSELPADGKDPVELRSLILSALATPDLRPVHRFAEGIDPSALTASHDGRYVALAETRGHDRVSVFVYRVRETLPGTELYRTFTMRLNEMSAEGRRKASGKPWPDRPDGFRSVAFSWDDRLIAAGTRNGEILEWDLHGVDEADPVNRCETEHSPVAQLFYSPDTKYWAIRTEDRRQVAVFDRFLGEALHSFDIRRQSGRIEVDCEGRLYWTEHEGLMYVPSLSANDSRRIPWEEGSYHFDEMRLAGYSNAVAILGSAEDGKGVGIYDRWSGNRSVLLDGAIGKIRKPIIESLVLSVDTATAYAALSDGAVGVWDGVGGAASCSLPIPERQPPLLTNIGDRPLLAVSGHQSSQLLQIRTADQCSGNPWNDSLPAVRTFALHSHEIQSFSVEQDGESLATLHGKPFEPHKRVVCRMDLRTGELQQDWQFIDVARDGGGRYAMRDLCVASCGKCVLASVSSPAFAFWLNESGFELVEGIFPKGWQRSVSVISDRVLEFTAPVNFTGSESYPYLKPAIALRFPRTFPRKDESIVFTYTKGGQASETRFDSSTWMPVADGWVLFALPEVPLAELVAPGGKIQVELISADLHLEECSRDRAATAIQVGSGFWVPQGHVNSAARSFGPAVSQKDQSVCYVDDETRLLKWLPNQGKPVLVWSAQEYDETLIRHVDGGNVCTLLGTRRGDICVVGPDQEVKTIYRAPRSLSGGETADEVVQVGITADDRLAIVGTVGGTLRLWRLAAGEDGQPDAHEAHPDRISSVAISDAGQLIASADVSGLLRLWRVEGNELQLLVEFERFTNVPRQLQFSPDGRSLFIRCEAERGLRVFELDRLSKIYREFGVARDVDFQ